MLVGHQGRLEAGGAQGVGGPGGGDLGAARAAGPSRFREPLRGGSGAGLHDNRVERGGGLYTQSLEDNILFLRGVHLAAILHRAADSLAQDSGHGVSHVNAW